MIDVLLPGERETLREPVTDLTDELAPARGAQRRSRPRAPCPASTSCSRTSRLGSDATNVDDIVNLDITASGSGSVDGEELPIGDLVLDNVDTDLSELDTEGSAEAGTRMSCDFRLTAVEEDGRWYLSLFHSIAETVRAEASEPVDIPSRGRRAGRRRQPGGRRRRVPRRRRGRSISRPMIATLNPNEFQALQRYAPIFLDDAQAELDEAIADEGVSVTIADPEYTVTGDGDTRSLTIDYFRVDVTADEETVTVEFEDGCWKATADDEEVNSCELAEDTPTLEEMFDDPEPIKDVLATARGDVRRLREPGLHREAGRRPVVREPVRHRVRAAAGRAAGARSRRDRPAHRGGAATPSRKPLGEDGAFELDEASARRSPSDDESLRAGHDDRIGRAIGSHHRRPGGRVLHRADRRGGRRLLPRADRRRRDRGLRGSDLRAATPSAASRRCTGAATTRHSRTPSSSPSSRIRRRASSSSCETGELTEDDLPLELSNPECLNGRNWFTAIEDEEFSDAVFDCAYG